jgi:hypothetical protein
LIKVIFNNKGQHFVENKGGQVSFSAKVVFATSNLAPEDWKIHTCTERFSAFMGRITQVYKFSWINESSRSVKRELIFNPASVLRTDLIETEVETDIKRIRSEIKNYKN